MKVRCINNTGLSLRTYEFEQISDEKVIGRFGVSELTEFGITLGKEYLVMGLIIFKTHQAYLIDENGLISTFPCQLFEIIDKRINPNWYFRLIENNEEIYPFVQAIFGYAELCNEKQAYMNLIVEMKDDAKQNYFNRKLEFELT